MTAVPSAPPASAGCCRPARCEEAVRLLGHGQLVTGRVTRGAGRGAGLGFPTANVSFAPGVLVPAFGVYRAEAEVDGVRYPACVNIGVHPTVGALPAPLLEANLIGFAGNLYGKELARLAAGPSARGDAV